MNIINWEATRFFFEVVQAVGVVAVFIYSWWTNRTRVTKAAIDRVEDKVNQHKVDQDADIRSLDRRLANIEQEVKHLPDHDDLSAIHEKINDVARGMSEVAGKLGAFNGTLSLLHEFLLNERKKMP